MEPLVVVLAASAVLLGLIGVVVPVLPGLLLIVAGIAGWALYERTALAWLVLGVSVLVCLAAQVVKYLVPGRRMAAAGVPTRTMVAGGVFGVVGFVVVPVIGLLPGFVLGVYLAERLRLGGAGDAARRSTVEAIKAAGLSVLIELAAGLVSGAAWFVAALVSLA